MEKITIWLYIIGAVAIAVLGNYLAATWASKDGKFSLLFVALVLLSPLVFISFGLVTSRIGVAVGSGTIDALLSISTVIMGLVIFKEWNSLSHFQYVGLLFVLCGIILLQFSFKPVS
jgi:multidrug transporter EmrE-like cation transporter